MNSDLIRQWVRPEIRALSAYHVADADGMVKLDAMENPYRWPEEIRRAWAKILEDLPVNRYPDPTAADLLPVLREAMGVPDGMDVLLGNGSDEIIQMIALAVAQPGRVVMAPEPGFVMYRMIATFCGMEFVGVPLKPDFGLDPEAMLEAVERHRPAVIFLAYPNNPTGNLFDAAAMDAVLDAAPGLVVMDEAYHAFADASYMDKLGRWDSLVIMRTVSKLGLAGLRLGLLAGPGAWLREFDKVRLPYNINVLTQTGARFALEHKEMLDEQTAAICRDREELLRDLALIDGLRVFPSQTNFVLFRTRSRQARAVYEGLKARGVLIKCLDGGDPALGDCLRVTVGTPEENRGFLKALRDVLGSD